MRRRHRPRLERKKKRRRQKNRYREDFLPKFSAFLNKLKKRRKRGRGKGTGLVEAWNKKKGQSQFPTSSRKPRGRIGKKKQGKRTTLETRKTGQNSIEQRGFLENRDGENYGKTANARGMKKDARRRDRFIRHCHGPAGQNKKEKKNGRHRGKEN